MQLLRSTSQYILWIYTSLLALGLGIGSFPYSYQGILKLSAFQAMFLAAQYLLLISVAKSAAPFRHQIHFVAFIYNRNQVFALELHALAASPFLWPPQLLFMGILMYLSPTHRLIDLLLLGIAVWALYFFILCLCILAKLLLCKKRLNQSFYVFYNFLCIYYLVGGNFLLSIEKADKIKYFEVLQYWPHYVFFVPFGQAATPLLLGLLCYVYPFLFLWTLKKRRDWL